MGGGVTGIFGRDTGALSFIEIESTGEGPSGGHGWVKEWAPCDPLNTAYTN